MESLRSNKRAPALIYYYNKIILTAAPANGLNGDQLKCDRYKIIITFYVCMFKWNSQNNEFSEKCNSPSFHFFLRLVEPKFLIASSVEHLVELEWIRIRMNASFPLVLRYCISNAMQYTVDILSRFNTSVTWNDLFFHCVLLAHACLRMHLCTSYALFRGRLLHSNSSKCIENNFQIDHIYFCCVLECVYVCLCRRCAVVE